MRVGYPSLTAEAMAAARAFGSHLYGEWNILHDPYAATFLSARNKRRYLLVRHGARGRLRQAAAAYYNRFYPGAVGWALTRHRYVDDVVLDAVARGCHQLVLIGAGYDTRALRLPALRGVRVLEIDHPATQARKLTILKRQLGRLPANVTYIPADLVDADFAALWARTLDTAQPTLIVLEGLLWYLPPAIARALLRAISSAAAPGSTVVFDYVLPSQVDGSCVLEGAAQHRRFVASMGEPIQSGIDPRQLRLYLAKLGYDLVDDVDAEYLSKRYAPVTMHPFFHVARARTRQPHPHD